MQELENWIMRIVTAAIIGGLADALTRKSRQNGLVRMTAALMLMLIAVSPLQKLDVQSLIARWEREARTGQQAADTGETVQVSLTREYAAQQLTAYVESCAAAVEIACQAQVELDDTLVPVGVHLTFDEIPSEKTVGTFLQRLCADLGLEAAQIEVTGI